MIRTFNFSFTWKLCCILVSWLCFLIKWYGKCSLLFYLSTENLFCVEIPQSLYDNQQGSQQGNPTWKGTWVQLTPYLNWVLLLLLLSRFSHVQLCVTPWTAAHQAPPKWDFPGKSNMLSRYYLIFTNLCFQSKHYCLHFVCASCVQLFVTPWTVVCQDPLPMEFSRREYWSGLPLPSPGLHFTDE